MRLFWILLLLKLAIIHLLEHNITLKKLYYIFIKLHIILTKIIITLAIVILII